MGNSREIVRVRMVVEDRRTERFLRELLNQLGFDRYKLKVIPVPDGRGDARQWVKTHYVQEVQKLRSKNYQRSLALIAACDGDNDGVQVRKAELDDALAKAEMKKRQPGEKISTPVPTWSIETWLLHLLGADDVGESKSLKRRFERLDQGKEEGKALRAAACAWTTAQENAAVPSFNDGRQEVTRLDP